MYIFNICFFFQAEDGIRDIGVTGVQTCALPIRAFAPHGRAAVRGARRRGQPSGNASGPPRSEERRVGKECRSGWGEEDKKKREEESRGVRGAEREECRKAIR